MNPQTWIPIAIIAVVMVLRMRRVGRPVPLKVGRLWVVPALYALLVAVSLAVRPPTPVGALLVAAGLGLGGALGWYRGRLTHMERDAQTGQLMVTQSALATLLLVGVIAIRQMARQAMMGGGFSSDSLASAHPDQVLMLTDAMLGFALGLISGTRAEWWLRARRMFGQNPEDASPPQ